VILILPQWAMPLLLWRTCSRVTKSPNMLCCHAFHCTISTNKLQVTIDTCLRRCGVRVGGASVAAPCQ
jgi:hypothetical protein